MALAEHFAGHVQHQRRIPARSAECTLPPSHSLPFNVVKDGTEARTFSVPRSRIESGPFGCIRAVRRRCLCQQDEFGCATGAGAPRIGVRSSDGGDTVVGGQEAAWRVSREADGHDHRAMGYSPGAPESLRNPRLCRMQQGHGSLGSRRKERDFNDGGYWRCWRTC